MWIYLVYAILAFAWTVLTVYDLVAMPQAIFGICSLIAFSVIYKFFDDKMDAKKYSDNLDKIEETIKEQQETFIEDFDFEDSFDFNTVKFKKLEDKATVPTRGSSSAAGYDLYACSDSYIRVPPHKTVKINTGIAIALPEYTFGAIYARSGLASKKSLRPINCVGVIDSDYRGEVIVALHNDSNYTQVIQPDDRIAQLVVQPYRPVEFVEVDELDDTERGNGGFGSTGD